MRDSTEMRHTCLNGSCVAVGLILHQRRCLYCHEQWLQQVSWVRMRAKCAQVTSRSLGYLWIFCVVAIIFGLLPWGIYELYTEGAAPHAIAFFSAGVFVSLAVPISIFAVAQHLRNFFNPELQRLTMRCTCVGVYRIRLVVSSGAASVHALMPLS